jgi:hypothetical protein
MSSNSAQISRWTGRLLIVVIWSALIATLAIGAGLLAIYADLSRPHGSFLTRGTGLEEIARQLYLGYFRPGWQDGQGYIDYDPALIYVPRPGTHRFRSLEFDVTLTFTRPGALRQQPIGATESDPAAPLTAIAGDSFAMGWGVEDGETFSTLLAIHCGIRTANAAVSSYGTARELLRLRQLGLLERASTVVIAFTANDADENHRFVTQHGDLLAGRNPRDLWATLGHYRQQPLSLPLVTQLAADYLRQTRRTAGWRGVFSALTHDGFVGTNGIVPPPLPDDIMAADFLTVLAYFPELATKSIVVVEINDWGRASGFRASVMARSTAHPRRFRFPVVNFAREDFFRFDNHPRPSGHAKIAAALAAAIKP